MGKSALVVERARCRPVPNLIATYSHAASNRETVTLLLVRAGQRAAHTLQLRGYNAGACPPTHEWALPCRGPDPIGWFRPGLPQVIPAGERAPELPA